MTNADQIDKVHTRLDRIEKELDKKAEKSDVERLDKKIDRVQDELKADIVRLESKLDEKFELILQAMDRIMHELGTIRTEQKAISGTLNFFEQRLGDLEQHNFGRCVRENKKTYE